MKKGYTGGTSMNRQLSLEFVRIVEQAAIKSGRLMGRGDKEGADQLAV